MLGYRSYDFLMELGAMSDCRLSLERIAEHIRVSDDAVYEWIGNWKMPVLRTDLPCKCKAEEGDERVRSVDLAKLKSRCSEWKPFQQLVLAPSRRSKRIEAI